MDNVVELAARSGRVPLALHACCGPCSLEPVAHLRTEGYEPVVLWANANIQPVSEHDLRLETLLAWALDEAHVTVVDCDAARAFGGDGLADVRLASTKTLEEARELWEQAVAPHGFDREARCRACYALRLADACRAARELGFGHVSTTLAVSPYQLFDDCTEILERLARTQGLTPVIRDWRPFYADATRESRELGMYRQSYCGCRFSAAEATLERHDRRDQRKKERAPKR